MFIKILIFDYRFIKKEKKIRVYLYFIYFMSVKGLVWWGFLNIMNFNVGKK